MRRVRHNEEKRLEVGRWWGRRLPSDDGEEGTAGKRWRKERREEWEHLLSGDWLKKRDKSSISYCRVKKLEEEAGKTTNR